MKNLSFLFISLVCFLLLACVSLSVAGDVEPPAREDKCPVCGMFVAKYPHWVAALKTSTEKVYYFDGVKDMMAFYFVPGDFGADNAKITDIRVTDYYSLKLIDGREARYVTGSDVLGPMGHELIPFVSDAAAENFMKDHHGKEILTFADITLGKISSMRMGHTMQMMKH